MTTTQIIERNDKTYVLNSDRPFAIGGMYDFWLDSTTRPEEIGQRVVSFASHVAPSEQGVIIDICAGNATILTRDAREVMVDMRFLAVDLDA